VQVGWGDLYPSNLPCQWIDVTGVSPGDYDLCVFLNTEGLLAEDPEGDEGCVPVTIDAPAAAAPRVKVRAPHKGAKLRVGHRLRVAWRRRARGALLFQDVWLSRDAGATYDRLAHVIPPKKKSAFRATIGAEMASDQARVKVDVCVRNPKDADKKSAGALQCAVGESAVFRIVP